MAVLRSLDFRRLFAAMAVSQFAHQMVMLCLPLTAIYALAATELQVGIIYAATTVAFLLVGLPSGVWVDRLNRRRVLIASESLRAGLLLTIAPLWWNGLLSVPVLCLVAFLYGVATVFFEVAAQSYLPSIVGRSGLLEGNQKIEMARSASVAAGPAVGGQLVAITSGPLALLAAGAALACSILMLLGIRADGAAPGGGRAGIWHEITQGLKFVLAQPLLRAIAACTAVFNLFFGIYFAMLSFFLVNELAFSAGAVGLTFAIAGASGVVGALLARRCATWFGLGSAIWISAALAGASALLVHLAGPGALAHVATLSFACVALFAAIYNVLQVSLRQHVTPDAMMGRMNATMRFIVWGTMPLGGVVGGLLGSRFGAGTAVIVGAAGMAVAFLSVLASPLRTMSKLPDVSPT